MAPHKLILLLLSWFAFSAIYPAASAQQAETCTQADTTAARALKAEIIELMGSTPDDQPFPLAPKLEGHRILTGTVDLAQRCKKNPEAMIEVATSLYMLTTFADDEEQAKRLMAQHYVAALDLENQSSRDFPDGSKAQFTINQLEYGEGSFFRHMMLDGLLGTAHPAYVIEDGAPCPYVIPEYVEVELKAHLKVFQNLLAGLPDEQALLFLPIDYRLQGLVKACPEKARSAQRTRAIMAYELATRTFNLSQSSMPETEKAPQEVAVLIAQEALNLFEEVGSLPTDPFISPEQNESLAEGDRVRMDELVKFIATHSPPSAPAGETPGQ